MIFIEFYKALDTSISTWQASYLLCIYICHTDNLPQVRKINLFFRPRLSMREPLAKSNKNSFLLLWTWSLKIHTFNLNRVIKMHYCFSMIKQSNKNAYYFFLWFTGATVICDYSTRVYSHFHEVYWKRKLLPTFSRIFFEKIFLFYILSFLKKAWKFGQIVINKWCFEGPQKQERKMTTTLSFWKQKIK